MGRQDAIKVTGLLQYPQKTAGRIMNPNVFAVGEETTVDEAIGRLRESKHLEMVFYIYVVDDHNRLVGVLSLRQLIQKQPGARLKDIMEPNVIRVQTSANQEEVARLVASYNLLAVPVVEPEKGLVRNHLHRRLWFSVFFGAGRFSSGPVFLRAWGELAARASSLRWCSVDSISQRLSLPTRSRAVSTRGRRHRAK